jgi:hypothetical protein
MLDRNKISEGGKWNSHHMPCVYNSRKVKNYRFCPIRIKIIHGKSEKKQGAFQISSYYDDA